MVNGKKLTFISRIKRDGSGTEEINNYNLPAIEKENYELSSLSITEKTYIAKGFNSYVVRLKETPELHIKHINIKPTTDSVEVTMNLESSGNLDAYLVNGKINSDIIMQDIMEGVITIL